MKDEVGNISTYGEAMNFARHIISRYMSETGTTHQNYMQEEEGSMLYNDKDILDKYSMTKSASGKVRVIDEFKDNINDELFNMIVSRERD